MPGVRHLARRFFGALSPAGPAPADEAWVDSLLSPAELSLWRRMSGPDRRHAVGVARQVRAEWAPAGLLHDVGKIEAGLGTWARVPATLAGLAGGRRWAPGRVGRYLRHDEIGSRLLRQAGSAELTWRWAADHHRPPADWTVPADAGQALKQADGD